MGPLSSPLVTSYRLPNPHSNHRPISHHFCSALTCHGETELVQQKVALRTKVHRPPKINNKIVLKTIAQVSCICKIFSWSCIVWT